MPIATAYRFVDDDANTSDFCAALNLTRLTCLHLGQHSLQQRHWLLLQLCGHPWLLQLHCCCLCSCLRICFILLPGFQTLQLALALHASAVLSHIVQTGALLWLLTYLYLSTIFSCMLMPVCLAAPCKCRYTICPTSSSDTDTATNCGCPPSLCSAGCSVWLSLI